MFRQPVNSEALSCRHHIVAVRTEAPVNCHPCFHRLAEILDLVFIRHIDDVDSALMILNFEEFCLEYSAIKRSVEVGVVLIASEQSAIHLLGRCL